MSIQKAYVALKSDLNLWQQLLGMTYPVLIIQLSEEIEAHGQKSKVCAVFYQGLQLLKKEQLDSHYKQFGIDVDLEEGVDLQDIRDCIQQYKKQKKKSPQKFIMFLQMHLSKTFDYCEILPRFEFFQIIEIIFRVLMIYVCLFSLNNDEEFLTNILKQIGSVVLLYIGKVFFSLGIRFMLKKLKQKQQQIFKNLQQKQNISYGQIDIDIDEYDKFKFTHNNKELITFKI